MDKQPTKYELIERDGRLVRVYESGMERDEQTGRIIKRPNHVSFTSETARLAHQARRKKMQAALRRGMTETYNSVMPNPARSSAEAFAGAMAMLLEQVALNSEAYPRDRIEVMDKIGKYTGLVSDKKESDDDDRHTARLNAAVSAANAEAAAVLARVLKDVQALQEEQARKTIDGKVIE